MNDLYNTGVDADTPYYNDVERTVNYLNHAYAESRQRFMDETGIKPFVKASDNRSYRRSKTKVMKFDEDFCHLMNEIQRGAECMVPLYVTEANELIDHIWEVSNQND